MPQAPSPNSSGMIADAEQYTSDRSFFGHPRGLSTLFFTEMWERFSYYGIRPLLVLFMTAALADGGFGFDRPTASAIVRSEEHTSELQSQSNLVCRLLLE